MPNAQYIKSMFDDISSRYDLLNDLLSAGTHRLWKNKLIQTALKSSPLSVLDCATGTGDIAFGFEERKIKIIRAIDFSPLMIKAANERKQKQGSRVDFQVADVSALPFEKEEFDVATISFGIRNVENLEKSLQELSRVSKNLFILEFGTPENNLWKKIYFSSLKAYFPIFSLLTKRSDAYDYLISSSEQFPSGEKFCSLLKSHTSFTEIKYTPLFGGIAYIYEAKRSK
jgi:demethylmenaquinone methyltransferase/2-methoxy-6-polyprenyl-1,4-benzoquinol methylase